MQRSTDIQQGPIDRLHSARAGPGRPKDSTQEHNLGLLQRQQGSNYLSHCCYLPGSTTAGVRSQSLKLHQQTFGDFNNDTCYTQDVSSKKT